MKIFSDTTYKVGIKPIADQVLVAIVRIADDLAAHHASLAEMNGCIAKHAESAAAEVAKNATPAQIGVYLALHNAYIDDTLADYIARRVRYAARRVLR